MPSLPETPTCVYRRYLVLRLFVEPDSLFLNEVETILSYIGFTFKGLRGQETFDYKFEGPQDELENSRELLDSLLLRHEVHGFADIEFSIE